MEGKPAPQNPVHIKTATPTANAYGILRQFSRKQRPAEHCELCSASLGHEHPHLIEISARRLLCACDACALLFDGGANRKYKRVSRRVQLLETFHMTDAQWDSLMIPINMAFFFSSSIESRVVTLYPSPAGAVESLLSLDAWNGIVHENPVLRSMQADVEALLVNRVGYSRGAKNAGYFIAPMDECYKLVGLIRTHWRGLSGGTDVWQEIGRFFAALQQRAAVISEEPHA
jgi:Family of unknown function (DUF5947)